MHQYQRPIAAQQVDVIPAKVPPDQAAQGATFAVARGNYVDIYV